MYILHNPVKNLSNVIVRVVSNVLQEAILFGQWMVPPVATDPCFLIKTVFPKKKWRLLGAIFNYGFKYPANQFEILLVRSF